jgi:beta-glucosidase
MDKNVPETKIKLPPGFLLGAAMSAHQVEGNNTNSDWWNWEMQGKLPKSGLACDHYNRYSEDYVLAKHLGFNSLRISIEWARIEPAENHWDNEAVEHYRKVLRKMKELGLVRMVTLYHFTLPQWLAQKGGFENRVAAAAFARYAWFIAKNLGDEIDIWCTINEPEVFTGQGYFKGIWPPFKNNIFLAIKVYRNLAKAHNSAYKAIKEVQPQAIVGIVKNNVYYEPYADNFFDKLAAKTASYWGNRYFLNMVQRHGDYIGLNYYFTRTLSLSWKGVRVMNNESRPKSDFGWQTYPPGIYHVLTELKRYNKPVYITENGIANARDDMREDYIRDHLAWALKAKQEGLDLRGYYYWSLIDNFEWAEGFKMLFGLVEINYSTQERKIRPSAAVIKEITNG